MKGIFKEVVYDWVPADKELKSGGEGRAVGQDP